MKIFDISGRLVRKLVDGEPGTGYHAVIWDGRNRSGAVVASGIYFYRIKIGSEFSKTNKMILLR